MRSDMAKVIVERPRWGSSMRGEGKGYQRNLQRISLDELPRREGIKHGRCGLGKSLSENLSPLRRYLRKQVGRPWNQVFAEICAHISRDSAVQDHVRDHVSDFVFTKVQEINGTLFGITRWGNLQSLDRHWYWPHMYVCPRTGILKLVKGTGRGRKRAKAPPEIRVSVDETIAFVRRDGVWCRLQFEPFPKTRTVFAQPPLTMFDALQNVPVTRAEAVRLHGRAVVVTKVRPATRDEIRRYCEPLKTPNIVR